MLGNNQLKWMWKVEGANLVFVSNSSWFSMAWLKAALRPHLKPDSPPLNKKPSLIMKTGMMCRVIHLKCLQCFWEPYISVAMGAFWQRVHLSKQTTLDKTPKMMSLKKKKSEDASLSSVPGSPIISDMSVSLVWAREWIAEQGCFNNV